jgi:hypothetical protein
MYRLRLNSFRALPSVSLILHFDLWMVVYAVDSDVIRTKRFLCSSVERLRHVM